MKKGIIYVLVIALIIVISIFFINLKIRGKEVLENNNVSENIVENSKETEIINDVPEIKKEESTINVNNVENNTEKQDEKEYKQDKKTKTNNSVNISKTTSIENVTTKQKTTTETIKPKQEEEKQEIVVQKQDEKKQNNITPIKEESKQETGEKYIINNEMINRIKNIINNNISEDMKTYGYNIVVDNSIPTLTNQFTFSEKRVKDKINYKFGTIKIYAQDYYNNGQYICTQCFII